MNSVFDFYGKISSIDLKAKLNGLSFFFSTAVFNKVNLIFNYWSLLNSLALLLFFYLVYLRLSSALILVNISLNIVKSSHEYRWWIVNLSTWSLASCGKIGARNSENEILPFLSASRRVKYFSASFLVAIC